ncbi:MAG: leucine-rich repeat domain-containing protein [Treponema sp.]|jgi:hypothetical protein|nr:leucine-rich repeat domain-containing protein [Treponema sp.]
MNNPKKLILSVLLLTAGLIMGAAGCKTAGSADGEETAPVSVAVDQTPLFTGDGGKGISLAILVPKAQGLTETQNYIPALVQGEFVSNFTGYSAISVLDRERLDEQYAEILSGYYDDDAEAGKDLGHLVPTEYIMGGSIIKTAGGYALQMSVTKTSDKTTRCSYSGTCTFEELDNLTGVRRASLDLLAKMNVQLTARAQDELSGAAAAHEVRGQTALARGLTAQRGGTVVEALSYYFQAASYDVSLTEAASRVNILTADITSGNMGQNIRNDIQWRDQWKARLAETEQVYADYMKRQPHYSLVYDVNLQHGETNYSNNTVPINGVTIDLVPDAAWFNTAGSVIQVVNVVREGLLATNQAGKWDLNWPRNTIGNSPFGDRDQRFDVVVELLNSDGKIIGSESITMRSGYSVEWANGTLRRFIPRMRGVQNLGFRAVNAYDITDSLTVRIARIDGIDAETAAKTKGINILREAEYARLPDVAAGVDSRALFRLMRELELSYQPQAYAQVITSNRDGSKTTTPFGSPSPAGWKITGYTGPGGKLVIPATIFGCSITAIGDEAFTEVVRDHGNGNKDYRSKGLTSVIIHNGITSIGRNAFNGSVDQNNFIVGLHSITLPASLTDISSEAFVYNNLTSIVIPNGVTKISAWTFAWNPLTSITIPGNVNLDSDAFGLSFGYYSNGFVSFYNKNGKKAGTYTRPDTKSRKWTYRP